MKKLFTILAAIMLITIPALQADTIWKCCPDNNRNHCWGNFTWQECINKDCGRCKPFTKK